MSRTTHDINLDHHGTLESSRIEQGVLSTVAVGAAFGQYYGTESLVTVFMSLDERLTAISRGYNIVADRFLIDSFFIVVVPGSFTSDAVLMPFFTSDAVLAATMAGALTSDSYLDPTVPGTKERTYLIAEALIE